jgi:hypothetical protein
VKIGSKIGWIRVRLIKEEGGVILEGLIKILIVKSFFGYEGIL